MFAIPGSYIVYLIIRFDIKGTIKMVFQLFRICTNERRNRSSYTYTVPIGSLTRIYATLMYDRGFNIIKIWNGIIALCKKVYNFLSVHFVAYGRVFFLFLVLLFSRTRSCYCFSSIIIIIIIVSMAIVGIERQLYVCLSRTSIE